MKLYILAGRPCSGKTTYAYHLGKRNNIEVKYLDVFAHEESQKTTDVNSELYKWKTTEMTDILQDDPNKLLDGYFRFYEELFPLLLNELREYTYDKLIIESSMLLPKYVNILKKGYDVEVVYLKTTDEFVKSTYPKRDYAIEMAKTEKGRKALVNLLSRDVLFAKYMYLEAKKYGYTVIDIKNENEFENVFLEVEDFFNFKR